MELMTLQNGARAGLAMAILAAPVHGQTSLKDAFQNDFRIGASLNAGQYTGRNAAEAALVKAQFNTITPENDLKWGLIHPALKRYNFERADRYVEFGERNHMFIVGHCLVWHNQTPGWVFQDEQGKPLSRAALLERMRDHIRTVVGRYKGRIKGWDVVNEAVNDDGTLRQSPWLRIIGEDYIAQAFEYAHEADPKAELYYNDYALENEPKRKGALELIRKLLAGHIPITAVGLQNHDRLDWPSIEQEDATIAAFQALGVRVNITELDVDVLPAVHPQQTADVSARAKGGPGSNPYTAGLPDAVEQALAKRYAGLFGVYLKHRDVITRVTFWGVTDRTSWLNYWPVAGRTNYPLLFDRAGNPKPAFDAVIQAARAASR
jgi:endo-1,4-beta-xylanase